MIYVFSKHYRLHTYFQICCNVKIKFQLAFQYFFQNKSAVGSKVFVCKKIDEKQVAFEMDLHSKFMSLKKRISFKQEQLSTVPSPLHPSSVN